MKVMPQGYAPYLVLGDAPCFVGLNLRLLNHRNRRALEELQRAGEAGLDSLVAVGMLPVLGFGPSEELFRGTTELPNHDFALWLAAVRQPLVVLQLFRLRASLVLWRGVQACRFANFRAVELESVVPFSAPGYQ